MTKETWGSVSIEIQIDPAQHTIEEMGRALEQYVHSVLEDCYTDAKMSVTSDKAHLTFTEIRRSDFERVRGALENFGSIQLVEECNEPNTCSAKFIADEAIACAMSVLNLPEGFDPMRN